MTAKDPYRAPFASVSAVLLISFDFDSLKLKKKMNVVPSKKKVCHITPLTRHNDRSSSTATFSVPRGLFVERSHCKRLRSIMKFYFVSHQRYKFTCKSNFLSDVFKRKCAFLDQTDETLRSVRYSICVTTLHAKMDLAGWQT